MFQVKNMCLSLFVSTTGMTEYSQEKFLIVSECRSQGTE